MGKVTRPLEPWRPACQTVEEKRGNSRHLAEELRKGRSLWERPFRVESHGRRGASGKPFQARRGDGLHRIRQTRPCEIMRSCCVFSQYLLMLSLIWVSKTSP